ncbi:MAG: hypothetical protein RMJ33_02790 [Saprospiraceae bacterium]|nr:hypothetical protein [Saprospiraceae bacterium]MDW8228744.1 hypothetical protein [Saprospiraceae bacterium]
MCRYYVFGWIVVLLWASCSSGGSKASAEASSERTPVGPVFRMSTARAIAETDARLDWCQAEFSETEVFGADASHPNRRFFYLRSGITWLTVGDDFARANLFLRPQPDGNVEVFTGAQFPRCLSRPEYLTIPMSAPSRLEYDNRQYIRFTLDVRAEAGGTQVGVAFPPDAFFAVVAVRCPSCGQ